MPPNDERPIVITGAGSGMGRATARLMASRGHPVLLVDINEWGLAETEADIRGAGGTVLSEAADVRSRDQLEVAFELGESELGPCWGLAAAAAVFERGLALDLTQSHINELIDVNLVGLVVCNQLAARQMRKGGRGGRIVNWASDAAVGASPNASIYGATKAAVVSFTKSVALELAPHKITANAIVPGIVDTPMADHYTSDQKVRLGKLIPVGRWGRPDEIATVAGFLFSDESSYISGSTVTVDGGATSAMGRHLFERLLIE